MPVKEGWGYDGVVRGLVRSVSGNGKANWWVSLRSTHPTLIPSPGPWPCGYKSLIEVGFSFWRVGLLYVFLATRDLSPPRVSIASSGVTLG